MEHIARNIKTYIVLLTLGFIIILAGFSFVLFFPNNKPNTVAPPVVENKSDIEIFSPKPNEVVSSPLKITGIVRGNGWAGFEGQVGVVHVFDRTGKELTKTALKATTDWTALPTNFEADVNFTFSDPYGYLIFQNENPSGDSARDKTFMVPVIFK